MISLAWGFFLLIITQVSLIQCSCIYEFIFFKFIIIIIIIIIDNLCDLVVRVSGYRSIG
jgi:hypothetical protein